MRVICMDCKCLVREVEGEGTSHGLCKLHYYWRIAPIYARKYRHEALVTFVLIGLMIICVLA